MVPEHQRVEAVRQILLQLYVLVDAGMPQTQISRVVRETIFFIYEGGDTWKYHKDRTHSAAARALRGSGKRFHSSTHPIIYDHAIPFATFANGLRNATETPEMFSAFLRRFFRSVVITRDEDRKLSGAGLASRMPEGAKADDLLARYRSVGIEFQPEDEAKLR